jgi:hypothetical protein
MEGYCSTGQSPQRAVVSLEEEEVTKMKIMKSVKHEIRSIEDEN